MPRSTRADGHDAETIASAVVVSTKLRAETSKIVGCVAKYFEEVEAGSSMTRRRNKRAKRHDRATDNVESISAAADAEAQGGGKEVPGNGAMTYKLGEIQPRIYNDPYAEESPVGGWSRCEEIPGGVGVLVPKGSSPQGMKDDAIACKDCTADEKDEVSEHHSEQYCHLTTLILPEIPLITSPIGYVSVKQRGEGRLRELVETLQANSDKTPNWNTPVLGLWSFMETQRDGCKERYISDYNQEMKTHEPLCLLSGPRRLQCGWCETLKSSENFLYDESSMLLKKMVRANAQMLLLKKEIVVPNVFEADRGRSVYDIGLPRSSAECSGRLQQLLLPFDLVRCDDTRIIDAPSKIVSLADSYLRSLQRPDVSLTRASMNIPSVWNIAVATDRLAELVAEERPTTVPQSLAPLSSSLSPRSLRLDNTLKPADVSEPLSTPPVSESRSTSLSTQNRNDVRRIATQTDQPSAIAPKLKLIAEDSPLSTDYFLSDGFLQCNWSEPPKEVKERGVAVREDADVNGSNEPLKHDQRLQQLARPALWDLMGKKLLQVDGTTFQHALNYVSLEALEATIFQQFQKVKKMCLNPSTFSSVEIVKACTSLRQAAWLHTLRVVSIGQARNGDLLSALSARILPSTKYKLVLGSSNWKDLLAFLQASSGSVVRSGSTEANAATFEEDSTLQPPPKRQRVLQTEKESIPVRVLCSVKFLEQDELLDELCTEQQIFFIERDLPPPIDILVDERNCICVVNEVTFQVETTTRNFIFSLAQLQVQLKKCWLVIALSTSPSVETEDMLNGFLAALVQFRIEIQVLTSFSCEQTGRLVRTVVDECAEVALNNHRVLPRVWFERPFLLEEVSQFERFLVSTKIVNHYAAQSLLHKICVDDLFSKSLDGLKLLVQNVLTNEQLELLWRLVQQDHGLNGPMQ
ncbi:hypothetical protein PC110_g5405 [Phytophthora cactorum]|uniref:Uncharacterized protein n=1 Tax=Phytophthora cactorum TaxID=29920 RepID=A0A329SNC0_9STRA|nr:hypothetical protein PC110_g5405 [Phytophthora cactorum]